MSRTAFSLIPNDSAIRTEPGQAQLRVSAASLILKISIACSMLRTALRREFELVIIEQLGKCAKSYLI
jgi:hypothetical protein